MAEGAFIEVVEEVIGKLGNLALSEAGVGLLSCVKDELEKLRNTCSAVHAVVPDAEEQQAQSHDIEDWLKELKGVVFKANNLLEDFSAEVTRREMMTQNKKMKKVRVFFSKSNLLAYDLKMGLRIKKIRKRLDAIEANRTFQLDETQSRNRSNRSRSSRMRVTDYFVRAKDVIGRGNDKKMIIERLLDSNIQENVSVLPIVGMGGLGKTTLAQLVFNDEEIQKHFEKKLWVCISDDFDVKIIVEKILECAKGEKAENFEINMLVNDLKKEIDGKRYLLVLDDVWNDDFKNDDFKKWDEFKGLLLNGARGSRILVTTREKKVAEVVKTIEPYFLRGLDKHESWSLFKQMAFVEGQEPENLRIKAIGMEIIEKYQGVPHAIKTIGRILHGKSEEEWLSFKNNELSNVDQLETGILSVLKLSYDHLPSHLKQCIAFCSLFPKDYNIKKQTLIRLWMAQGFIKSLGQNKCLEDVGHEYFMELLSRSFFQEVEEDKWGNISFKIHDIMHDLLILVSGKGSTIFGENGEHIDEQTHHVSFGIHLGSLTLTTPFDTRNLRTFLLCGQQLGEHENGLNEETCDAIVSHCKFLRILDFHETGIKTVPSSISKLNHLRYLDLSGNRHIKMVPTSLSRLQYLQTLKLSGCVRLKELPRDISKLVNLRFLENDGCRGLTHMPCGLGQLTNLQTLSRFVMSKDTSSVSRHNGQLEELNKLNGEFKELDKLNNLRGTLEIVNLRHDKDAVAESEAANLKEKQHLQALGLRWIEDEVDEENVFDETSLEALQPHSNLQSLSLYRYGGVKFPTWLSSLINLVEIALFGCKKWQHLPPLDQFPSLKVLELDSLPALEYISNSEEFSNSSFLPSLEELKLKYCPNLKGWWLRDFTEEVNDNDGNYVGITSSTTSMALFSRLSKLCIWGCPKLTSMPLFPYLEKLELYNCSFKPLERTTRIAASATTITTVALASSSSSSPLANFQFAPLSKLKSLEIGRMEEPLPDECLLNLISLNHLWIYECHGPLLQDMQHLTALEQLDICSSEVFDLSNDKTGMEWQSLRSLNSLWLFQLPKLESLPVGLQHVTSLRKLTIDYCPSLTAIPNWICSLTSLEILEILQCPKLTSLPMGISHVTSLHTLKICNCPILLQSCKTGQVEIAHIPNLYLEEGNSGIQLSILSQSFIEVQFCLLHLVHFSFQVFHYYLVIKFQMENQVNNRRNLIL
jgi:Leucine-rich repeat (LRR) protein